VTANADIASTRVYVDLIGDLFHWGDVAHLQRASRLGDVLVVGVLSDGDVTRVSHVPVMTLAERVAVIAACRHVAEVIPAAPLAPDAAFLDRYRIDTVCLSDDHDDPARQAAFAALLDSGRGVALLREDDVSTADLVARIVARGDLAAKRPPLTLGPTIHPPPATADDAAVARLEAAVSRLTNSHDAVQRALAVVLAGQYGAAQLLPGRVADPAQSATLATAYAVERLALDRPARDDLARAVPLLARVDAVAQAGWSISLIGDQARAVGYALAGRDTARVVVLQPGGSRSAPPDQGEGPRPGIIGCAWSELPAVAPVCDLLAVLDHHVSAYLLGNPALLWALAERVAEAVLLVAPLTGEAAELWRPREGGTGLVYSDAFVRGTLHEARFFEVRDIGTLIDGLPVAGSDAGRVSRFTYRQALQHGRRFRFIDGKPPEAVARSGTAIERWYIARKGPLAPSDTS